ncbi:MAG: LLM class flavin-dependent oxidoreductase, partial [Dehalococcoidia bacterium]
MRLGYFSVMQNPGYKLPYRRLLTDLVEETLAVEEAGYHAVWLGEHHFGGEGFDIIPNPITIASNLAAETSRIRLGFAAVIVTQWHPLRIAEDIALLDQISEGRVECGVGRGIFPRELTNFNSNADRRDEEKNWRLFKETVQIMKKAWTEDPFRWEGEFYRYPHPGVQDSHSWHPRNPDWRSESGEYIGMSIQPKPFQKPHPPLWNVVDKTPGFAVAAEMGLKPISWLRAREGLREAFGTYQEAASRVQGRQLGFGE